MGVAKWQNQLKISVGEKFVLSILFSNDEGIFISCTNTSGVHYYRTNRSDGSTPTKPSGGTGLPKA